MKAIHGTVLGLTIVLGGWACNAQVPMIPFNQIERDGQLTATLELPASVPSEGYSSSAAPALPLSGGFIRTSALRTPRTVDSKFLLLNGLHLGLAMLDVGMTQHCLAAHTCREGNPMMPSSLAGQLSVDFALVGYGAFSSYRLKRHKSSFWWISPTVGATAHGVGVASGIAHE